MWDDDAARFATSLKQGLTAIATADRSELRRVADDLITLGRTALVDAPWWLLQGAAPDIAKVATALAEDGERGRARDLLMATASFFTHTGGLCNDMAERVLAGDDDALFDFVREAHSPGLDLEALGMDAARIVTLVRRRLADPSATEETASFALGYVRERDALEVLIAALARFPDSEALWLRTAQYFLDAGQRREAAVAYCRSLDARVPPAERTSPSIADDEMIARVVALRRSWVPPVPSMDRIMVGTRCARTSQPTLINVALLCRALDGAAAARQVVARYAAYVSPREAAIAFVDAGGSDEAIAVVLRALQDANCKDRSADAVALARIYLTLGRSVEAVAAARVLLDRRRSGRGVLDELLNDRHLHRGPSGWQGLLPTVAYEAVRDAAIDALVRDCPPGLPDREELIRCLRVFDDGSSEARAASLAALRESGRRISAVVREQIDAGSPRMRVRLGWLLEEWAWEAAEERFRSATGLRAAVVASPGAMWARPHERPGQRVSARLDTAIECLREVELGPAYALVDWICERSAGHHDWRLEPDAVAQAADLLVCEGQVERAGRLLRATVSEPQTLARFRDILAVDAAAAFDAVVANRDWPALAAMGVDEAEVVRIAAGRLAADELPLEATRWLFSRLKRTSYAALIRPALRRFPDSPTLLALAGGLLLEAGRRRSALRVFTRAADARRKPQPPSKDPAAQPAIDDPDADAACDHQALRVLAGYPPALPGGAPRATWPYAAVQAHPWQPLLVNVAILEHERRGRRSARDRIARYAESSSVLMTAASLRAIGDVDDACALLEREMSRRGTGADRSVLNGLLAAYAGMGRMRDALAVVALVMQSYEEARFHVGIMISMLIDQTNDEIPDDILAYERRFAIEPAEQEVLRRLTSRAHPPSESARRASSLVAGVGSADHGERTRALVELRRLGPAVAPVVAASLPALGEAGHEKLRDLLSAWAWDEEIARMAERLSLPPPASLLAMPPAEVLP